MKWRIEKWISGVCYGRGQSIISLTGKKCFSTQLLRGELEIHQSLLGTIRCHQMSLGCAFIIMQFAEIVAFLWTWIAAHSLVQSLCKSGKDFYLERAHHLLPFTAWSDKPGSSMLLDLLRCNTNMFTTLIFIIHVWQLCSGDCTQAGQRQFSYHYLRTVGLCFNRNPLLVKLYITSEQGGAQKECKLYLCFSNGSTNQHCMDPCQSRLCHNWCCHRGHHRFQHI